MEKVLLDRAGGGLNEVGGGWLTATFGGPAGCALVLNRSVKVEPPKDMPPVGTPPKDNPRRSSSTVVCCEEAAAVVLSASKSPFEACWAEAVVLEP